ncbi:MAG: DNA-binding protein [Planctomycetes bacterium]|nr:DNA-binding protein [Planctomycetota bacterium]
MDYQVGRIGRVIVAKGVDGENVYAEIESIAARENIRSAAVLVVGGLRSGKVVVGPKNATGPIEPQFAEFDDAREIVGVGTIFRDGDKPVLHLHGAIGRGDETIAGCPRGGATVFCVLEVVIAEITGINAERRLDAQLGLKLLTLLSAGA